MRYVKLGGTNITVSQMGMGTAPIGDLYNRLDERATHDAVRAACHGGITLFDTSPLYGFGLAESRLGSGLRQCSSDLRPVISTKVGRRVPRLDDIRGTPTMSSTFSGGLPHKLLFDYSFDGAFRSLEQSLLRLGVENIDIALIHDVDVFNHGEEGVNQRYREAMEGCYAALDSLRSQGVVKMIGVGVNEADMAAQFIAAGDFDCVLLAGRYSLLEQPALDEFLPLAERKNVAVMLGGVFNSGILASGAFSGAKYNYSAAPEEVLAKVRRLDEVCRAHSVMLRDAALRFPLGHNSIKTVVVGAASAEEVEQNLNSLEVEIPDQLWDDLKSAGLLSDHVPVPVG